MAEGSGFLEELRRRGVVRAGLLYAAGAFALLEFADIAFPRLGLPDGAVGAVLWIGIAGFPAALVVAWMVEVRAEPDPGRLKSWLSPTTVFAALVLVGLGVGMGFWWGGSEGAEDQPAGPSGGTDSLREREPSVAVLRFTDLSGSQDHAYFAAGLSEEISTALSRFRGIRVIAPSAAYFEETSRGAELRAGQFGITYLLRGSVLRSPETVRVAVQLLDAASGAQIWGQNYDAGLESSVLLETHDRIAGQVASAVGDFSGVIMRSGRVKARRPGTDRFEAYDCVLLGLAYLEIHTADIHARARDCLERAVRIDPEYADAWAHLGHVYREEDFHGYNRQPGSLDRAVDAVRRAIELDPTNPMAHFSLAQTYWSLGDVERAIFAMERAVELNPNDSLALAALAAYLMRDGQLERAFEIARATAELNPLHPFWLHNVVALSHYMDAEYREALAAAARVPFLERDNVPTLAIQAAAQAKLGQPEARATLEALTAADADFADAPMSALRLFMSEEMIAALADGLRLAGLELD